MIQKQKDLLLKDLCARLPYEPIVEYVIKGPGGSINITSKLDTLHIEELLQNSEDLVEVKPYLRPMSSMTEEEREELKELTAADIVTNTGFGYKNLRGMCFGMMYLDCQEIIDWLNKNMFDYRGLIEKGIAIEVTEDNNPYKID